MLNYMETLFADKDREMAADWLSHEISALKAAAF